MSTLVLPVPGDTTEAAADWGRPGDTHVRLAAVSKVYPGQQVAALHEIDLDIRRGEIFGIIGRSGAGKSTLIRTLNRLERPTGGQVVVDGTDLDGLDEDQLVAYRRRTGMIFQHFNLLSAKTVRQNIELPLRVAGVPAAERQRRVDRLVALVGLEARQDAYPAQLSGGQKQRVGIARALVHDPALLLCDEATSALDPETTHAILDLLRRINQEMGITIVLITHEMEVIHEICHRVAVLDNGQVVEQGPVWQVYGNPRHATTRRLLTPQHDRLGVALSDQPADPFAPLLVRLRYHGDGVTPNLRRVLAAFPGDVTLVESALEPIQGRTVGHLLLAVTPPAGTLLRPDHTLADHVEVLGYVAAN